MAAYSSNIRNNCGCSISLIKNFEILLHYLQEFLSIEVVPPDLSDKERVFNIDIEVEPIRKWF